MLSASLYGDLTDRTQIMDEDAVRTTPPHEEKNAASRKGKGKAVFAFRVYLAELAAAPITSLFLRGWACAGRCCRCSTQKWKSALCRKRERAAQPDIN